MRLRKMIGCLILVLMCVCACTGFAVAGQGYQMYRTALAEVSLEEKTAQIQAQDGYTELEELPETYLNAVISVEDHRFYQHSGIDFIAIARAVVNDIRAGSFVEACGCYTQEEVQVVASQMVAINN